jgi:hypothetical protein
MGLLVFESGTAAWGGNKQNKRYRPAGNTGVVFTNNNNNNIDNTQIHKKLCVTRVRGTSGLDLGGPLQLSR